MTPATLGVVLVNYRRAADTIECLETLLRSSAPLQVAVVDNASGDGSIETIMAWAAGTHRAEAASSALARLSAPPLRKPLPCTLLTADAAGTTPPATVLTVIDAGSNRGFAGGNNLGLRHLLLNRQINAFWLLNNDTVVAPDAAAALLARMAATPRVGMCGTRTMFYWQPDIIQALNGSRFNLLTGTSRSIGGGRTGHFGYNPATIAEQTDFVLGASLAVSRAFLETVGPMEERYFLYFEEIDWAVRNRRRGDDAFETAFAHGAIVWHKEGGSIGSSGRKGQRSAFSDYWLARSRLAFMRRHYLWLLPWHWLVTLAVAGLRLVRRQPDKAGAVLRALMGRAY